MQYQLWPIGHDLAKLHIVSCDYVTFKFEIYIKILIQSIFYCRCSRHHNATGVTVITARWLILDENTKTSQNLLELFTIKISYRKS